MTFTEYPMIWHPSPNYNDRPSPTLTHLIIHYTGMVSAKAALERLSDPASQVSAHYLIDENGSMYQLVKEDKRAWHAGLSYWRGTSDLNNSSIGVELVNRGHEWGYHAFPKVQIDTLIHLAHGLTQKYTLSPTNILGHSDIAPSRKQDPGELFPWQFLYQNGIGAWPNSELNPVNMLPSPNQATLLLRQYGYDTQNQSAAISAFQRHFRPRLINGEWDKESIDLLINLCTKYTIV